MGLSNDRRSQDKGARGQGGGDAKLHVRFPQMAKALI
jgi:hypothetical protein